MLALSDGRLFMAGGVHPDLGVVDTVVTIRPGDRLADESAMRLFVPRTDATASETEGLILVAGGRTAVG